MLSIRREDRSREGGKGSIFKAERGGSEGEIGRGWESKGQRELGIKEWRREWRKGGKKGGMEGHAQTCQGSPS